MRLAVRGAVGGGLLLILLGLLGFLIWAHRPAIAAIDPPRRDHFSTDEVARGAMLAREGYCLSCHQAEHGRPYAGGYGVRSPFGTLYGSNITPDPETGIGCWSRAAFVRALREGVSRDGHHLYPALPYDHFTQASDADLAALYAFVMTRDPVRYTPPAIVQSLSWTAHEAVTYDARHRTAFDWSGYPILRFDDVPRSVVVEVIDRPGQPFLGTGEASQGPAAAALANAIDAAPGNDADRFRLAERRATRAEAQSAG